MTHHPLDDGIAPAFSLSDDDVAEFHALIKAEYGEDLTPDEARDIAAQLLRFYWLITSDDVSSTSTGLPHPLLTALETLVGEIAKVGESRAAWRYAVSALHDAVHAVLLAVLRERESPHRSLGMHPVDLTREELPKLLLQVTRESAYRARRHTTEAVTRLEALYGESNTLTLSGWLIVADYLPALAERCLTMIEALAWNPGYFSLSHADRTKARALIGKIRKMLHRPRA